MEQLRPAGPLLATLLAAGPRLSLLVTSRARLRLRGEREWSVEPLAIPEVVGPEAPLAGLAGVSAVRLFVERVAEVRPGFALTPENAAAVAAICRRLDGLPLALELAAARARSCRRPPCSAGWNGGCRSLTDGPRDLPARQQTMRDTIAWSHDLLDKAEQAGFRRLAVFVGGFGLDAAEAVAADDALDLVASLCEQSLLRPLAQPDGEPRFAPLETVREHVGAPVASGESESTQQAHAAFYAALAGPGRTGADRVGASRWLDRLETELDNLRAALTWSIAHDPGMALRLAAGLWRFWYVRGHLREGREFLERALAHEVGSPAERARAYHAAGDLAQEQGNYAQATTLLETGLTAARTGEQATAAQCLNALGFIARNQGAYEQADRLHGEALALQRELADRRAVACSLANLGSIAQQRRETERAEALSPNRWPRPGRLATVRSPPTSV